MASSERHRPDMREQREDDPAHTGGDVPGGTGGTVNPVTAKGRARAAVAARRASVSAEDRSRRDRAIAELLPGVLRSLPTVDDAPVVCAFVPDGGEAGGTGLPALLHDLGAKVLLPVPAAGGLMDWAHFTSAEAMRTGRFGIPVPDGPPLGPARIASADLVLVPAVAVDRCGRRLGRGGGYYDRALARVPAGIPLLSVLDDEDVWERLPVEEHDRPVHGALTPGGLLRFRDWHSAE